jgi:uncharacterized protein (TIGR02145 family)
MIITGRHRDYYLTYGNGLLYNWYAVNTGKLAPLGCHVPTSTEFFTFYTYLGGASVAGGKMKSTRTSAPYFSATNVGATNESGFTGYGGGFRKSSFQGKNTYSCYWASTENNSIRGCFLESHNFEASVHYPGYYYVENYKYFGVSIRCLVNDGLWWPGRTIKDFEGNIYPTVKIGNQVWLQSNLKSTKYNDGTSIPNVTDNTAWAALTTPGYCSYNNAAIVEITQPQHLAI